MICMTECKNGSKNHIPLSPNKAVPRVYLCTQGQTFSMSYFAMWLMLSTAGEKNALNMGSDSVSPGQLSLEVNCTSSPVEL